MTEGDKPRTVLSSAVLNVMPKVCFQTLDSILVSPEQLCTYPAYMKLKFIWCWLFTVQWQSRLDCSIFFSAEPCQIEVRLLLAYNSNKSKASTRIPKSTWSESLEALPPSENGIEGTIPFSKPVKVYIMPKPARRWRLALKETYSWGLLGYMKTRCRVQDSKPSQNSLICA